MVAEHMLPVEETFYGEYFERAESNTVFLLNEGEAGDVWCEKIDPNSSSYFDLPDDCWVVSNASVLIGNWMESYNRDDVTSVAEILRVSVDWDDSTIVKFFAKKKIIFLTTWCDFLKLWDEFIAIEDDCPIVVPENHNRREALLFRPIGDILKIGP